MVQVQIPVEHFLLEVQEEAYCYFGKQVKVEEELLDAKAQWNQKS